MAFIKDNKVVLKSGENIIFDDVYPIKIIWPVVLMSNRTTVYNCITCDYVVLSGDSMINDIFYCYGEKLDDTDNKIGIFIIVNNSIHFLKFQKNSIASVDYAKIIFPCGYEYDQNTVITELIFLKDPANIIIYSANNAMYIKNCSNHTVIDKNCGYILSDKVDGILKIYLLKNNHIRVYSYDIGANLVKLKQEIPTHIDVNKNIRSHMIDHSGLLHCINIDDNQIVINKIKTEYRFYDITISNLQANKFLLLTFDDAVISYDGCNTFVMLSKSGSFCLKKNLIKSARV